MAARFGEAAEGVGETEALKQRLVAILAADVAQEVRKLQPDFSLAKWAERQPYRDATVLARIVGTLRQAGLS